MMTIHESAEDYLEQILMLLEAKGHARSIDIAIGLNVSKPSVSVAMKKLRENGYITMGKDGFISLTDKGYAIARRIYDRHKKLTVSWFSWAWMRIRPGRTPARSSMICPRNPIRPSAQRSKTDRRPHSSYTKNDPSRKKQGWIVFTVKITAQA